MAERASKNVRTGHVDEASAIRALNREIVPALRELRQRYNELVEESPIRSVVIAETTGAAPVTVDLVNLSDLGDVTIQAKATVHVINSATDGGCFVAPGSFKFFGGTLGIISGSLPSVDSVLDAALTTASFSFAVASPKLQAQLTGVAGLELSWTIQLEYLTSQV